MNNPRATYTVVIPTLNEASWIATTIGRVRSLRDDVDVVVADGASTDATREIARRAGARVITAARGRGSQCAAGARVARGDVLVFLHADTNLPDNAFDVIDDAAADARFGAASFRLAFDRSCRFMRCYAWFSRFDTRLTRFGDQGIVMRRRFLERIGGFPEWPLFEDVEVLRRARRHGRVRLLPATVVTSARRFNQYGVVRTQLFNVWLMFLYLLGASPERLARQHESFWFGRLRDAKQPRVVRIDS